MQLTRQKWRKWTSISMIVFLFLSPINISRTLTFSQMVNSFIPTWQGKIRELSCNPFYFPNGLKAIKRTIRLESHIIYNFSGDWEMEGCFVQSGTSFPLPEDWPLSVASESDKLSWSADPFCNPSFSPHTGLKCPSAVCSTGQTVNTWLLWS